jgi:hypothetical protein
VREREYASILVLKASCEVCVTLIDMKHVPVVVLEYVSVFVN